MTAPTPPESGDAPEWALSRVEQLIGPDFWSRSTLADHRVSRAFARYIAAHEEPPIADPIEEEAQAIVRAVGGRCWEDAGAVEAIRIALRRGIEIERARHAG